MLAANSGFAARYRPRLCENSNIAGKINALLDWF